jgi:hypothetical protein
MASGLPAFGACADDAARLAAETRDLPRLEAAPPDKQITCITLETNMDYARRLIAHVARCPASPLAADAARWATTRTDYTARFRARGCKAQL